MRLLLSFITLFSLISSAFAATTNLALMAEWRKHSIGGFYVNANDANTLAYIGKSIGGYDNLWFRIQAKQCAKYENTLNHGQIIEVNGIPVKISSQCLKKNDMSISFTTEQGFDFVLNEFKYQKFVTVKFTDSSTATYSTRGFRKAWANLVSPRQFMEI